MHPSRLPICLQIYKAVKEEAKTVQELTALLKLDPMTVYYHTKALQTVGLIDVVGTKKTPNGPFPFLWKATK